MIRRVRAAWSQWSTITVLALYQLTIIGLTMVSAPWLDWDNHIGSPFLAALEPPLEVVYGLILLGCVAMAVVKPRWFGAVCAFLLAAIRLQTLLAAPAPHNVVQIGAWLLFCVLAVRGARIMADRYDRGQS